MSAVMGRDKAPGVERVTMLVAAHVGEREE